MYYSYRLLPRLEDAVQTRLTRRCTGWPWRGVITPACGEQDRGHGWSGPEDFFMWVAGRTPPFFRAISCQQRRRKRWLRWLRWLCHKIIRRKVTTDYTDLHRFLWRHKTTWPGCRVLSRTCGERLGGLDGQGWLHRLQKPPAVSKKNENADYADCADYVTISEEEY